MASTLASNERIWGTYTTDDSTDYNISCKKAVVEQADAAVKLGYAAGAADQLGVPNELKPRRVKCVDSAGNVKWVICYTTSASMWTTAGTTFLLNFKGVDTTFTATKYRRAENLGRSITKSS